MGRTLTCASLGLVGVVLLAPRGVALADDYRPRCAWLPLFCLGGRPHVRFPNPCPLPACDPCGWVNFGYHPTRWQPWPFPPDDSHCLAPPPAVFVPPPARAVSATP